MNMHIAFSFQLTYISITFLAFHNIAFIYNKV